MWDAAGQLVCGTGSWHLWLWDHGVLGVVLVHWWTWPCPGQLAVASGGSWYWPASGWGQVLGQLALGPGAGASLLVHGVIPAQQAARPGESGPVLAHW